MPSPSEMEIVYSLLKAPSAINIAVGRSALRGDLGAMHRE